MKVIIQKYTSELLCMTQTFSYILISSLSLSLPHMCPLEDYVYVSSYHSFIQPRSFRLVHMKKASAHPYQTAHTLNCAPGPGTCG